MTSHDTVPASPAPGLALADGGFAMLALDQRESLRRMFPLVHGREVDDETLRRFKRDALDVLSPKASAVLLDRLYALDDRRPAELADDTALILAVDVLIQPPGLPVSGTELDREVTPEFVEQVGADALKLLVIWRERDSADERAELVASFLELAEQSGVVSLVEGIVRPSDGDYWTDHAERHEAILAAAAELGGSGTTIYKAEVPGYVPGDVSLVREHAERLTAAVPVPWVVLSNGVAQDDFADALRESVAGGASGFLAGRAIWSDTVAELDPSAALRTRSTARLDELGRIVSEARGADGTGNRPAGGTPDSGERGTP
ncbi:aldolase [Agromyces intestinalis]|uniref:Aldolase n=1 Tax=Agromyces intestinalis TaxID=2592652 RepID=A0A5C1YHI2_9MICO|nr:aldolase [Agromyces intestinalis]QEO15413.1 aldolase [Agromyces intestinalis]